MEEKMPFFGIEQEVVHCIALVVPDSENNQTGIFHIIAIAYFNHRFNKVKIQLGSWLELI